MKRVTHREYQLRIDIDAWCWLLLQVGFGEASYFGGDQ